MVIRYEDAIALDPNTGMVDPELWGAYSSQQDNLNAQLGSANAGDLGLPTRSDLTLGQQYLQDNADVFNDAIARANSEGLTGGDVFSNRLDEIALEHFNTWGRNEGRSGFGYTAPEPGTFAPGPNETPTFFPQPVNGGGAPGNTGGAPGFAQPTPFDFDQYNSAFESALGNFNGLLDSYNSFFGDMLDNAQDPSNMQPQYGGGFLPFATTLMPLGGGYQTSYNPFNTTMSSGGGGWNSGSSWGGGSQAPGQAANTSHQQWFTF